MQLKPPKIKDSDWSRENVHGSEPPKCPWLQFPGKWTPTSSCLAAGQLINRGTQDRVWTLAHSLAKRAVRPPLPHMQRWSFSQQTQRGNMAAGWLRPSRENTAELTITATEPHLPSPSGGGLIIWDSQVEVRPVLNYYCNSSYEAEAHRKNMKHFSWLNKILNLCVMWTFWRFITLSLITRIKQKQNKAPLFTHVKDIWH